MRAVIKHYNSGVGKNQYDFFTQFVKFLQKHFPLKHDITICFLGERVGQMTTGSRRPHLINILSKNRMNRDICRTLAHEWVHEYQLEILNREMGPDIGGENEDEANSEAGKLIKMFEKEFPDSEPLMYE